MNNVKRKNKQSTIYKKNKPFQLEDWINLSISKGLIST